jgi:hypothetical protein
MITIKIINKAKIRNRWEINAISNAKIVNF